MDNNKYVNLLIDAFNAAVERVEPYKMIKKYIKLDDNGLIIKFENKEIIYNLDNYEKIFVFAIGKAAFNMGYAIETILGKRIDKGVIVTKYGHIDNNITLQDFDIIEAGHPVPDENSIKGAKKIYDLAKDSDEKTLIINLISGGGSALFTLPDYGLTLEDMQKTTQVLLECGANITEINSLRKHISKVKGGKFARVCYPAKMINIILSDVIGDRLDSIASGISVPDNTSFNYVYDVIKKYNIESKLPEQVIEIIEKGLKKEIDDTPKEGDLIFNNVENILLGNNYSALLAAKKIFKNQSIIKDISPYILTSHISGEAKEIAKFFASIAIDGVKNLNDYKKPFVIIAGGETTVTIKGKGKGGRNQEMILSFLLNIMKYRDVIKDKVYFLSCGTDGTDGPTDAAGAVFQSEIYDVLENRNLNPLEYLNNNDSYNFFNKIGYLIKTGPTNTNVCDIQILLVI